MPAMPDDRPEPIADTAAFRAFSAGDQNSNHAGRGAAQARRPSAFVWITAVVVLVAMVAAILATVL